MDLIWKLSGTMGRGRSFHFKSFYCSYSLGSIRLQTCPARATNVISLQGLFDLSYAFFTCIMVEGFSAMYNNIKILL